MAVLFENSLDNYVSRESGDIILFTGTGNTLSLSDFGATDVFVFGTDQTVSIALQGQDNVIYDFGRGTDILTGEPFASAQVTVYDFQRDPTAKVTLLPFQTATETADGHGGTLLSLAGGGSLHFVHDPHVTVVTS